jgi:hypothetical protein
MHKHKVGTVQVEQFCGGVTALAVFLSKKHQQKQQFVSILQPPLFV